MTDTIDAEVSVLRRRLRVILLLDALNDAGLVPIPILHLHAFAYLTNVLSPVWQMPVMNGKVLKRQGGPFYPDLQFDMDRMVGMGMIVIYQVGHVLDDENNWRLDGKYKLNHALTENIFQTLSSYPEEAELRDYIGELAFALSSLSDEELGQAFQEDATYSDPVVANNNVVNFEDVRKNYSANAAQRFDQLDKSRAITPGEKINLYVSHLQRRMVGGS